MQIRDLFVSDVTRDIAPVVYFHEQSSEKISEEIAEYIVTGGYPQDHPHHQRVPDGIHEQYVSLLNAIVEELERNGGPDLPASWISGFYGSGKSSFAKLLGLALDGVALPDGRSVAEALLARDTSPLAAELRKAWEAIRQKVDPIAVVFDIGGMARNNEHIHSAIARQVQKRLGYCSTQPLVAEFELSLERDGQWNQFESTAKEVLGRSWEDVKDNALAEEEFSHVMSVLNPERYTDPMSWFEARAGIVTQSSSVEDATRAIADMLRFRARGKTLFIVVDEVSQYIHQDQQRMLKLQSLVSELGQRLKGKAWLLVTGQQKLEETDETHVLGKLKGRFKPKLRVHLAATNIRDVVHKRLLQKTPEASDLLRDLFRKHRNDLKLFAYACEDITEEDFVDVYPMLPGHIELLLQITTALRTRSSRSQGDDQAIRGLLQLLGELFRRQNLAEMPVGNLITLDRIYEVQHSALDSDVQNSMTRVLAYCAGKDPLLARVAKGVAMLELVQETLPTHAALVASCLFDQLDEGNRLDVVTEALETLRRDNLLGFSEKHGYKLQSSSGEEWERERRDIPIPRDDLVGHIQESLKYLISEPARPTLQGRAFPWKAYFSDSFRADDILLVDPRDPANVTLDLRMLSAADRTPTTWVNVSGEQALANRIIWLAADSADVESLARDYARSLSIVKRHKPRRESLARDRLRLLLEEEANAEDLELKLRRAVDAAWMAGTVYFQGRQIEVGEFGGSFTAALGEAGSRFLSNLYPHFLATQLSPAELLQLLDSTLLAPSPKFVDELGLLSLDAGKYVPSCEGVAPRRVLEYIESGQGVAGTLLLNHFGSPPYGYVNNVVRACVAGLLRADKLRIQTDEGRMLTSARDAGIRDVFEKDRDFRRANYFPSGEGAISASDRNRICRFFEVRLGQTLDRDNDTIADAVSQHFPLQAERLRVVLGRIRQLPDECREDDDPHALAELDKALQACYRVVRHTEPTVKELKRHLDALNDGLEQLAVYVAELTDDVIRAVREAADIMRYQLPQLEALGEVDSELAKHAEQIRSQLQADKPWRDLALISQALQTVCDAYVTERGQMLNEQGEHAEKMRTQLRTRSGFSTLTADQSHHVLRPIAEALPITTDDAIAPPLTTLRDQGLVTMERAREEANERLDQILSSGKQPQVRKVSLGMRNREVATKAELESVLDEVRTRVEPELDQNRRVRLDWD